MESSRRSSRITSGREIHDRGHRLRSRELKRLLLIVLAAVTVRVFTLWIGKPEFTGWLNHTYYYFVQVRGLLADGTLPYSDMPILFHLYAFAARFLMALGLETDAAIVSSTRIVMILVPALIPIPIFATIKNMQDRKPLLRSQWLLVSLSAFLPLTLKHIPEFLQKNMFGLLLLAILILYSQRMFQAFRYKDLLVSIVLALVIVLSHYGTFGAMTLYGVAAFLAIAFVHRLTRQTLWTALGLSISGSVALVLIYFLDVQRFQRLFLYLRESFGNSLVIALFRDPARFTENLISLIAILAFYVVLFLSFRASLRNRTAMPTGASFFFRTNVIFCGLLVLPVYDQQLMGRLAVFTSIPLLIVFAHLHRYYIDKQWIKTAGITLATLLVALLAFGEIMDSVVRGRSHASVLSEIQQLKTRQPFESNDLIVTTTGAEHICNWFYGVKSGVITSLYLEDFTRYDNIYVLNPIEGELNFNDIHNKSITSDSDRYLFMRRNIPRPEGIEPLFLSDNLELFLLHQPPESWQWASDGRWRGY